MHHPALKTLLTRWAMQHYYEVFKSKGVENVETLLKLDDHDIGSIIHINKINDRAILKSYLNEYKEENVSITKISVENVN